jgi:hypothetical protein
MRVTLNRHANIPELESTWILLSRDPWDACRYFKDQMNVRVVVTDIAFADAADECVFYLRRASDNAHLGEIFHDELEWLTPVPADWVDKQISEGH